MLDGVLGLWFILTLLSLFFVAYDCLTNTPEAGIMKAGWILVTLYTGPIGCFFYLLSCREPIPGAHEKFTSSLWKQSIGSEVHCLAGDATGIIVAAFILSFFEINRFWEILIEYLAGFGFGLLIFQSLFMKKMMGGSYVKAVKHTFLPEWLSMNMIMAGMIPVMVIWSVYVSNAREPSSMRFWGMMSFATLVGGIIAYPINQWMVNRGLKHGMMTIRKKPLPAIKEFKPKKPTQKGIYQSIWISVISLVIGIGIAIIGRFVN